MPFITDTRLTETGQTINTIQYQDVGIIVNVTPHVNPEGLVILDVAPEISQVGAQTVAIYSNSHNVAFGSTIRASETARVKTSEIAFMSLSKVNPLEGGNIIP